MKSVRAEAERIGVKVPVPSISRKGQRLTNSESAANGKASQATRLVELTTGEKGGVELWHTPEFECYATVVVGSHKENQLVNTRAFKRWIAGRYYREFGNTPSSMALQDALNVLSGNALYEGEEHPVHTRLASYDGSIYLDLTDEAWQAVKITSAGWGIVSDPPVKFRRSNGMMPIPAPVPGGEIKDLQKFVNVIPEDWVLLEAWLVAALTPDGPYPVLVLHGEQGSAKSTLARIAKMLIDPNKADLRSEPGNPRDLMIAATNSWIVAIDNLSRLQIWFSDAICRLATGGGFGTRKLFENYEEALFDAKRPIILNGITELATRGDLLDRSIILYLPSINQEHRQPETEFWRRFEDARPSILGALLDATVMAMRNIEETVLKELPRMADFALWSVAAEPAFGVEFGSFLEAYSGNRKSANQLALEVSPIVPYLRTLILENEWQGTATNLLKRLNGLTDESTRQLRSWPKGGSSLGRILNRLAPNLREDGIEVSFQRNRSGRNFTIRKVSQIADTSDTTDTDVSRTRDGKEESVTRLPSPDAVAVAPNPTQRDGRDGNDGISVTKSDGGQDSDLVEVRV